VDLTPSAAQDSRSFSAREADLPIARRPDMFSPVRQYFHSSMETDPFQVDSSRYLFDAFVIQGMADTNSLLGGSTSRSPQRSNRKKLEISPRPARFPHRFRGWLLHQIDERDATSFWKPSCFKSWFPGAAGGAVRLKRQGDASSVSTRSERRTNNDVPLIEKAKGGLSKNHYASRW